MAVIGALVLFMVACMVTSAVSRSSHVGAAQPKSSHVVAPKSSHVVAAPPPDPQFSSVGAISDVVRTVEGFLPCLETIKGLKDCSVEILKAVFGPLLDASCCQVVNQIAINCLPKGFPLSHTFLPVALGNCINAPAPPASVKHEIKRKPTNDEYAELTLIMISRDRVNIYSYQDGASHLAQNSNEPVPSHNRYQNYRQHKE
ncbi:Prolamin-like domain [Forsythia ovata]|uniref:Prolamin-like domain n=1 Tax=Forsythia ovata TaxID=205694 RepID=A0ABD1SIQ6_9LAMI